MSQSSDNTSGWSLLTRHRHFNKLNSPTQTPPLSPRSSCPHTIFLLKTHHSSSTATAQTGYSLTKPSQLQSGFTAMSSSLKRPFLTASQQAITRPYSPSRGHDQDNTTSTTQATTEYRMQALQDKLKAVSLEENPTSASSSGSTTTTVSSSTSPSPSTQDVCMNTNTTSVQPNLQSHTEKSSTQRTKSRTSHESPDGWCFVSQAKN